MPRSHLRFSSIVTKILLCIVLLSFVLLGASDMMRRNWGHHKVATVGKTDISYDEWQQMVEREKIALKQVLGDAFTEEQAKILNVRYMALQHLINRQLLSNYAKDLKLHISEKHIAEKILSIAAFQDEKGKFQKEIYKAILRTESISEKAFVESLEKDLRIEQLVEAILYASFVPDSLVNSAYDYWNEERKVAILHIPFIKHVKDPSEDVIQQYYNENKALFFKPEERSFTYVPCDFTTTKKDITIDPKEIYEEYLQKKEIYTTPEQRIVDLFYFTSKEDAEKAYQEWEDKGFFPNAAQMASYKSDQELLLSKNEALNLSLEPIFTLQSDHYSYPLVLNNEWVVCHIKKILPENLTPFETVKDTITQEIQEARLQERRLLWQNEGEDAIAGGASLEELGQFCKADLKSVTSVNLESVEENPTHPSLHALLMDTAFRTSQNTLSNLTFYEENAGFILRVDQINEKHDLSFEEAKLDAKKEWIALEGERLTHEKALDLRQKWKENSSITHHCSMCQLELREHVQRPSGESFMPITDPLIVSIFQAEEGEVTSPLLSDEGGYNIVKIQKITALLEENRDAVKKEQIKKHLVDNFREDIMESFMNHLRSRYPVVIDPALFQE